MSKQKQKPLPKPEKPAWYGHTCDECSVGKYDTKFLNLDIYGNPTLIQCPHQRWKRLRRDEACKYYQPK